MYDSIVSRCIISIFYVLLPPPEARIVTAGAPVHAHGFFGLGSGWAVLGGAWAGHSLASASGFHRLALGDRGSSIEVGPHIPAVFYCSVVLAVRPRIICPPHPRPNREPALLIPRFWRT